MERTTRIIIEITSEGEPCSTGIKVERIARTISVDNELVYSDRMKADIYNKSLSASDPIRNLEMFLLGLEKRQSGKNGRTNTCNFISCVKMVWRKLLCK